MNLTELLQSAIGTAGGVFQSINTAKAAEDARKAEQARARASALPSWLVPVALVAGVGVVLLVLFRK